MLITLLLIVVVLGGIATFLPLGGWKLLGHRFEDDTSLKVAVTEIRVEGGGSGSVEIRPGAASQVDIHRTVFYLKDRPGATSWIKGTVLYLDTGGWFRQVSYIVDAPEGVRVTGSLGSGDLQLTSVSSVDFQDGSGNIGINGASGTVRLEDGSGRIQLSGITGDITAKNGSGPITGRELRSATINVTTASGAIFLDLATPANVRAQTSDGGINLTVPNVPYRVDTKVSRGRIDVQVANDPTASYHLDLSCERGDITVTPR